MKKLENIATGAIEWIGSTKSLVIHTLLFVISFLFYFLGFDFEKILLIVTTIVSLEAIYLAIFIQMSVNIQSKKLDDVALDVDDIQENVEDIQEDVDDIQEDVDELQKDIEEIQKDIQEEDEDDTEDILMRIEGNIDILMNELTKLRQQNTRRNKNKPQ